MSADKKELSPEERLLQVIQKGNAENGETAKLAPPLQPPPKPQAAAPSPSALKADPPPAAPPQRPAAVVAPPPRSPAPHPVAEPKTVAPSASPQPAPEGERKLKLASPPSVAAAATAAVKSEAVAVAKEATVLPSIESPGAAAVPSQDAIIVPGPEVAVKTGFGQLLGGRKITVSVVNRCLFLIALVLLGAVIYDLLLAKTGGAVSVPNGGVGNKAPVTAWKVTPLNPVNVYTDLAAKRDIWKQMGGEKGGGGDGEQLPQPVKTSFKLVALSIDRGSPAESMAIIADQSRTYFVKSGQPLGETGYTLEKVFDDRVILKSRKGEVNLP